jgi:hypothetical protein
MVRRRLLNTKGQNVVEYLLVVVTVVLVALYIMNTQDSPMKRTLENVLNDSVGDIDRMKSEIRY